MKVESAGSSKAPRPPHRGSYRALGELATLVRESIEPAKSDDRPYLALEHIDAGDIVPHKQGNCSDIRSSKFAFRRGDVLYGKLRPYLDKAVLAPFDGIASTEFLVLRPEPDVDSQFLAFAMHTPRVLKHAIDTTAGVNHPRTSWESLRNLDIYCPLVEEQRRIAQALSAVLRAGEIADRTVASRLELAASLGGVLFPRSLSAAPPHLGVGDEIDWIECALGDQIAVQRGFDITKSDQRPGDVPVVSSSGVHSFHDTPKASAPGVVIGRKGSLGTAHFLPIDYWPHDTTLWVTDFRTNLPQFVYHFFRQLDVSHLDVGASNPTLNRNHLYPTRVIWPDLRGQKRICAIMDAVEASAGAHRHVAGAIRTTLASVMSDYMGGSA